MAAQSAASRSRRPQRKASDADDAFVARTIEFTAWARRNATLVVLLAVAAVVLIGGILYYRMYRADRLERAAVQFMQIEQTAMAGNPEVAVRDLERFAQQYDGTPYADEARVLLGRTHLEAGQPQQAVAALDELAGRIGDSPLAASAGLLLATAQMQAGNPDEAVATYLRVADEAGAEYQRQEALTSAAMLREQAGDLAGAAELYRRLLDAAEEGTMQRSVYEMRLAEVEARAGTQ